MASLCDEMTDFCRKLNDGLALIGFKIIAWMNYYIPYFYPVFMYVYVYIYMST